MVRRKNKNNGNKAPRKNNKKKVDDVKIEVTSAKAGDDTSMEVDATKSDQSQETAQGKDEASTVASSDGGSDSGAEPKGKKETEAEARESDGKENSESQRENESSDATSSSADDPETAKTGEASKTTSDSSDGSTTDKVEEKKLVKIALHDRELEVPPWFTKFVKKRWVKAHGAIKHPRDGSLIELHAINTFDQYGKPIPMSGKKVEEPVIVEGMDDNAINAVNEQYNSEVRENRKIVDNKKLAAYKRMERKLNGSLHMFGRIVHCYNGKRDKALNICGTLVGLMGGKEPYVCLIRGKNKKGEDAMIRRGFKFVSLDIPDGASAPWIKPVETVSATDVEKRVDKKLLEDKSSKDLVFPEGYEEGLANLLLKEKHTTILVMNSDGQQLSFIATPDPENDKLFRWVSLDMTLAGKWMMHNSAIPMTGSVQELMRVTSKVNQDNIDDMMFISIPESDHDSMVFLMELVGLGAVGDTNGKEDKQ